MQCQVVEKTLDTPTISCQKCPKARALVITWQEKVDFVQLIQRGQHFIISNTYMNSHPSIRFPNPKNHSSFFPSSSLAHAVSTLWRNEERFVDCVRGEGAERKCQSPPQASQARFAFAFLARNMTKLENALLHLPVLSPLLQATNSVGKLHRSNLPFYFCVWTTDRNALQKNCISCLSKSLL